MIPGFYRAALNAAGIGAAGGRALPDWSPEVALAHMGVLRISTAILSVSTPGAGFLRDAGERASMARRLNDYAADLAAGATRRFRLLRDAAATRAAYLLVRNGIRLVQPR